MGSKSCCMNCSWVRELDGKIQCRKIGDYPNYRSCMSTAYDYSEIAPLPVSNGCVCDYWKEQQGEADLS